jgi:hypothetical protein
MKMKKTKAMQEEQDAQIYSTHVGLRFKPHMHETLKKWAKLSNLPPSIFVRQIVLDRLDELELDGEKRKK